MQLIEYSEVSWLERKKERSVQLSALRVSKTSEQRRDLQNLNKEPSKT